jgi:hypothetical protein
VGRQLTVEWRAVEGSHNFDSDQWLLFNLDEDFSESTDLAHDQPDLEVQAVGPLLSVADAKLSALQATEEADW